MVVVDGQRLRLRRDLQLFQRPQKYQYRVLFWGILAAIVMRLAFVLIGGGRSFTISNGRSTCWVCSWIYTASMVAIKDDETDPEQGLVLRLSRRLLPVAKENHGDRFLVRRGRQADAITPLFLVLIVINATDFVFAFDSVPAIFGLPTIRSSSLRRTCSPFSASGALYFLLAGVMDMFRYLKYGLSAILLFVGLKMLLHWVADPPPWWLNRFGMAPAWAQNWIGKPPAWASLVVVLGLLTISIGASVVHAKIAGPHEPHKSPDDDCAWRRRRNRPPRRQQKQC